MAKPKKVNPNQRVKKTAVNSEWFGNVAKSMRFTATDMVKELMPNTTDFLSYNVSDSVDMMMDMRRNTGVRNNLTKQISNIPQVSISKDFLKNALEDVKSGKIVNKDRGNDFGDDLDFGFDDLFDDDGITFSDEGEDSDITVNKNTVNNVIDTLPLARSIAAGTEASINAMAAVADQNMAIETEKMLFNHKATNSILGGLTAVNDNLSTLVKFHGDSTTKFYAASIKYYEESLEEMRKMMKASGGLGDTATNAAMDASRDPYTYTGGIKLSEYTKMIKDNLMEIKDESVLLSSMSDVITNKDNLRMMSKNPLGMLSKMVMRSMIPIATKASVAALDASISGVMPALIAKINSMEDNENPIFAYVNKVFNAKNKLSYGVDLGKYEKGAIPWDGECKKSLVEVIPAHLRRIEAALTGKEERVYDYTSGKFTSYKDLETNYNTRLREVESSGFTEARTKMRDIAMSMNANKKVLDQFEKDMTEYFSALTKKGSMINPFISSDKDGTMTDSLLDEGLFDGDQQRINLIRTVFKGLDMKDLVKIAGTNIYDSRKATQSYMDEIRKNPNLSGYSSINDDGYRKDGKLVYDPTKNKHGVTDKFGLSQLDYLRDIRSLLVNGIPVFTNNSSGRGRRSRLNSMSSKIQSEEVDFLANSQTNRSSASSFTSDGFDYDELEGMSDSDINDAYRRAKVTGGKDNKLSSKIGNKMYSFNGYLDLASTVVDNQMYKLLFGNDDNKSLESEAAKSLLLEKTTGKDSLGGILGKTMGFFQDTIKGVGAYFTGQSYIKSDGTLVPEDSDSMLGKMKSFFNKSTTSLLGDKDVDSDKGLFGKISNDFMDGYNQFRITLFGEGKSNSKLQTESIKSLTDTVKKRMPKAIGAGLTGAVVKTTMASQLGVLGSILLPGGPLGAAVVGTTMGFLSQSDTFKNWLFGEKDPTGMRMGGFIPKSLTDMISSHGGVVKTGAIAGGAVGLLPSFFLPGGPVTGAVMGIGAGLLSKSDGFQKFIFGDDYNNKDSKKSMMNGTFGKLFKNTLGKSSKDNPKLATFLGSAGMGIGVAQGIGLLPSFLLPGGPILGAMLGLAGGITASSDKFQQFLFGDKEDDGSRYGGLMTKFTNWFDTTVISPFKMKANAINDSIYDFVNTKMINPLVDSFAPLTQAVKFAVDDAKDGVKNMWGKMTDGIVGSFNDNVVKPFGASLEKYIVDPIKKQFNNILKLVGKGLGAIITSPVKLISGLGGLADRYNARHVLKDEKRRRQSDYVDSLGVNGNLSMFQKFGKFKAGRIGKDERESIVNSALPYRQERDVKRAERKAAHEAEMAKRKEKQDALQSRFEEDQAYGKSTNWKYASKKQKERHEQQVKDKVAWLQEQTVQNGDEAVKKLNDIEGLLGKLEPYQKDAIDALNSMKKDMKDLLKTLTSKGYKPSSMVETVGDVLRDKGQSHATGLDNVPKDGYIAELHEGEMVVPKDQASTLRGAVSGNNSIVSSLTNKLFGGKDDEDGGVIGKMFSKIKQKEDRDKADNALGLTEDDQNQLKELGDMQRKSFVSRKDASFIQSAMLAKKKEKDEKDFRDKLLGAIEKGNTLASDASSFWDNLFGRNGLIGKAFKGLGGLLNGILGKLGVLGSLGLGAAGAFVMDKINQSKENNGSVWENMTGYGDEGQLNKDGLYARDNTGDVLVKTGVRRLADPKFRDKFIQPFVDSGKTVINTGKKAVDGVKKGVGKVSDFLNPTEVISGKTVLGETYEYSTKAARKGIQKPAGAAADFTKAIATKGKNSITTVIEMGKTALKTLQDYFIKKFPKLSINLAGMADNIFGTLAKNSDTVMKQFGPKIAAFTADVAADLIPIVGQVTEAACTAWDIATGLSAGNTANLFQVNQSEVDITMRGITSVMQGVCKFSFFQIIWLINEICSSLMDMSFLTHIARTIYTVLSGTDMRNDLQNKNLKGMTVENIIKEAGGNTKQFEGLTSKDLAKAKADDFEGITAPELQDIQRAMYNQENGTNMDRQGFNDEMNKTVGQKIMGSKFMKNLTGTFKASSIRGHLGLDDNAKVSLFERGKFAAEKSGLNILNFGRKMFGMEEVDDKDYFQRKDKNGLTSADRRSIKEKEKIDKANAKINARMEKGKDKKGVSKWVNDKLIGIQKGKRDKARKRLGSEEAENDAADLQAQVQDKKSKDKQFAKKQKKLYEEDVKSDPTKAVVATAGIAKAEKKAADTVTKTQKTTEKSIDKIDKSNKKATNTLTKGMEKTNKTMGKSLADTNKALSKKANETAKSIKKETDTSSKKLDKQNKGLTKTLQTSFDTIKKKTDDMLKNVKNVKVSKVNTITPTFTIDDPFTMLKDMFTDILDKAETKKQEKKEKKDNNAGSSGVDSPIMKNETPKVNVARHTITASDFINPSDNISTTNNNSNTSNKFVFYNQADSRWGGIGIGKSNMKDAGCGPTSLAMAVSQMTGEQITPDTIAEMGRQHLPGYSTYSLFPSIANQLNMNYEETKSASDSEFIISRLKKGLPVLLSGKNVGGANGSPYTPEGHIVTASKMKGNMVFVQDPRGKEYSKYYPIQSLMNGLNKGMVLSPSLKTKYTKLPSAGKIKGWNKGSIDPNTFKNPMGLYGDGPSLADDINMGKTGGKVRVVDKVLSYMRAFLNQTSKFKYSQPQRDGINKNKNTADCSSFVGHVLSVAGDTPVSGTSQTMWDSTGTKVDKPQVGDIVCQQGHVGLYSGDGNYIHMSGTKYGIKESKAEQRGNNPHRGYKRVLKDPNAMVDAIVNGGNSLLGTVTATNTGVPVEGGAPSTGDMTTGGVDSGVDALGVFGKLGNIGQNMMASIFNGKQVDLFASQGMSDESGTTPINPNAASWNGTQYDLSKYDMSGLSQKKQDHINKIIHPVLETYKTHNLLPSVTIAQSVGESGWGPSSGLATKANNLFGIKTGSKWTGKTYSAKTGEYYDSGYTTITDTFRAYDSMADSVIDRANFLSASRYSKMMSMNTPQQQFQAMKDGGYATNPNYVSDMMRIVKDSNLTRFDNPKPPVATNAGMGGEMSPEEEFYINGLGTNMDLNNMGGSPAESAPADGSIPDAMNGWAYYKQGDPRWNTEGVGSSTVARGGCGPTSHAMMLSTMFGKKINPLTMTKWGHKNGTWTGAMQWSMPPKVAEAFNLSQPQIISGKSASALAAVKSEIKAGRPVIMSGKTSDPKNAPFTTGGHIVLGVGVDGNNNIIINDSRGPQYTKAYTDAQMQLGTGLRQSWSFAKTSSSAIPSNISVDGEFTGTGSYSEGATDATGGTAEQPAVDPLGVFGKLGNIGQNMMASIFNGKQVDLFASSGGSTSDGASGGSVDISGISDTKQAVWKYYTGLGYTPEATAGIMGNFQQESTINPTLIQGNGKGPAAGIAQWENYNKKSDRWKKMSDHAASKGKDWTDLQSQLEYVDMELAGVGSVDKYTNHLLEKKFGGYQGLKSSKDINRSTEVFEGAFERAGIKVMDKRKRYAKEIYNQMTSTANPSGHAGMGDGKTHIIKPAVEKGAKPISSKQVKAAEKVKQSFPAGLGKGGDTIQKLKKKQGEFLQGIKKIDRTNMNKSQQYGTSDSHMMGICVDAMVAVIDELKAINVNTANTAKSISDIQIISASTPVSEATGKNTKSVQSVNNTNSRKANDKTGYDTARSIASFMGI